MLRLLLRHARILKPHSFMVPCLQKLAGLSEVIILDSAKFNDDQLCMMDYHANCLYRKTSVVCADMPESTP